jgi:sucrose-6-phosphate hydrolase SacC (GH32 family)
MHQKSVEPLVRAARTLRTQLQTDPQRPRYHLIPPEGWFNDANGALYWNGRYHLFYLARTPIPDHENLGKEHWAEVWDHASSADLVHWVFHRPALVPETDGTTPNGIWSGGAVSGAPKPTLIYHVPKQGTCLASSDDPLLEHWTPFPENPVIPITEDEEYVVFDPCAWREQDGYYALIGNRNRRSGYEGDCTSLFRSSDLRSWEYIGPFYRSRREWTDIIEDAACPDFFPLGSRHMLLLHGHRPYNQCRYYLGRYESGSFEPEEHGRMNWSGGGISAPETLIDKQGRRIFFAWIAEADSLSGSREWRRTGWASVMSLPRILEAAPSGGLRITPVPELERLRTNHVSIPPMSITPEPEAVFLPDMYGDSLELDLAMSPGKACYAGVAVRCSPGGEELTCIFADLQNNQLVIDVSRSSGDPDIRFPAYSFDVFKNAPEDERYTTQQRAPFTLAEGELLCLRIFIDRSVLEVFANERICMTQRIYPQRPDSSRVRLLADKPGARLERLDAWAMMPAAPW